MGKSRFMGKAPTRDKIGCTPLFLLPEWQFFRELAEKSISQDPFK
jgi:hypothetical protein